MNNDFKLSCLRSAFQWLKETMLHSTYNFRRFDLPRPYEVTLLDLQVRNLTFTVRQEIMVCIYYLVRIAYTEDDINYIPLLAEFEAIEYYRCVEKQSYRGPYYIRAPDKRTLLQNVIPTK